MFLLAVAIKFNMLLRIFSMEYFSDNFVFLCKDLMPRKVLFQVVHCSGADEGHSAKELEV